MLQLVVFWHNMQNCWVCISITMLAVRYNCNVVAIFFSVKYVKYVCSTFCHMICASEFICGIYMHMHVHKFKSNIRYI